MKTFRQFVENYAEKTALLRQKQMDHLAAMKQRSQQAVNDAEQRRKAEQDRKDLKREIKREIQQGDYD